MSAWCGQEGDAGSERDGRAATRTGPVCQLTRLPTGPSANWPVSQLVSSSHIQVYYKCPHRSNAL